MNIVTILKQISKEKTKAAAPKMHYRLNGKWAELSVDNDFYAKNYDGDWTKTSLNDVISQYGL